MKQPYDNVINRQRGLALPIVVVILLLAALITLYVANTSRKEQQVSADQYRTEQSLNAAMAGLDWAIDYYNSTGLDSEVEGETGFGVVDYLPGSPMQWCIGDSQSKQLPNGQKCSDLVGLGDLVVQSRAFFCDPNDVEFWSNKPETCDDAVIGAEKVGVVAIGYSDDNTARRVITVVLAGAPLLPPTGPGQPLTTKESVAFNGGIIIINRYFNSNVWSGESLTYSGTPETYIGDSSLPIGVERFVGANYEGGPKAYREMMTTDSKTDNSIPGALSGSGVKRGNNADVLENDPVLANLSICTDPEADPIGPNPCTNDEVIDEFFQYFLNADKKTTKATALGIGQFYDTCAKLTSDPAPPTSGVIWVDEDCDMDMDFGSFENPAALFVNGDTGLDSNTKIFGLVYVAGTLTAHGGSIVKGSVIVEGDFLTQGAGTMDLVYDPVAVDPGPSLVGRRSIVFGTWKDWGN